MSAYKKRNELVKKGLVQDNGDVYIAKIFISNPHQEHLPLFQETALMAIE